MADANAGATTAADSVMRRRSGCEREPIREIPLLQLMRQLQEHRSMPSDLNTHPWTSRFVMGMALPEFQRNATWSREQAVR